MKYIELTQGQRAQVDDADYEWLSQWKWQAKWNPHTQSFYAARTPTINGRRVWVPMASAILGCLPGQIGDHVHHDTLDNRRSELRICTRGDNQHNQKAHAGGTSAYKGVFRQKERSSWRARIRYDGRQHYLGSFADELDAARAYDAKAREIFGEFSCTNL